MKNLLNKAPVVGQRHNYSTQDKLYLFTLVRYTIDK